MKIAEYKQINTEVVREQIFEVDENGEQIERTIEKEIPVMGVIYRDATPEEEAEALAVEEEPIEPTLEDEIKELKARNEMLEECLIELANIIYA